MNRTTRAMKYLRKKKWNSVIIILVLTATSVLILSSLMIIQEAKRTINELNGQLLSTFMLQQDAYNEEFYPNNRFQYEGPKLTYDIYNTICSMDEIQDSNREKQAYATFFEFADRIDLIPGAHRLAAETRDWSYTANQMTGVANNLLFSEQIICYGNENTRLNSLFTTGKLELVQGRHIEFDDHNVILISEDIAKANELSIGDVVHIGTSKAYLDLFQGNFNEEEAILMCENPELWDSREFLYTVPYQIVGVFSLKVYPTADYQLAEQEMNENLILMDYSSMEELWMAYSDATGWETTEFEREYWFDEMTFEIRSGLNLEKVIQAVKEKIPITEQFRWTTNNDLFNSAVAPMRLIEKIVRILAFIVVLVAGIICVLIMLFWNKARKREIGVLLSVGETKWGILWGFLIESLIITVFALMLSLPVCALITKSIDLEPLVSKASSICEQEEMLGVEYQQPIHAGVRIQNTPKRNFTPKEFSLEITKEVVLIDSVLILFLCCFAVVISNMSLLFLHPKQVFEKE